MFYRLILLRVYADGRISNQTSIHPTQVNASNYAKACIEAGSSDYYVVIEERTDDWNVVESHLDTTRYEITCRNNIFRIERIKEFQLV